MKASDYKDETKGWPRTVRDLKAKDFVDNDGALEENGGCKRCFLGWVWNSFDMASERYAHGTAGLVSA